MFYFRFRILSISAGLLLGAALIFQNQSNNVCIWRVTCCFNIPIAFIMAYSPKHVGKFSRVIKVCFGTNILQTHHLIYIYTVGISIRTNIFFSFIDSVLWLSWSITMSSLHTFLLLVFSIQILRAVTAERQYNSYTDDEKSTYLSSVSNNRFNIFRYEDGRECTGILIILLWIKLTNYVRSPR